MKTYAPKPRDIERRWYVIDADGAVLGRLASEVAAILRGKHKPIYAPHADAGDHVIVVNAGGVELSGNKAEKKIAYRHSGYPGGITATSYDRLMRDRPVYVVEKAVRGMLPKTRLGRAMIRKLSVYEGAEHPHRAQKPVTLRLGEVPPWSGLPEAAPPPPEPAPKRKTAAQRAPATEPASTPGTRKRSAAKRSGVSTTGAAKKSTAKTTAKTTAKSAAKATSAKKAAPKKRTSAKRTSRPTRKSKEE
jgi:large subunit ribosomal protein L13